MTSRLLSAVVVTMLCLLEPGNAAAFTVTGVSPSGFPLSDAQLGITGFAIEDFEDGQLAAGLAITYDFFEVPLASGPLAFSPSHLVNSSLAWDGTQVLRTPHDSIADPHSFSGVTRFTFSGGITEFGIGISDNGSTLNGIDVGLTLVINGATFTLGFDNINNLSGFQLGDGVRNFYLRVSAGTGEVITDVRLDHVDGDTILYDRLAFLPAPAPVPEPTSAFAVGLAALATGARANKLARRGSRATLSVG